MSIELFLAYLAACALLALTPGPAMSLIIANGATLGARAGLRTVAGNSLGLGLLVTAVVLGMSTVMTVLADWFDWLRWVGAAYLIWLGASRVRRAWRGERRAAVVVVDGNRCFWQGVAVALSNPKVLLFLGAFFPHFVDVQAPLGPQLALLGVGFVLTIAAIDGGMALCAGWARQWFNTRWRLLEGVSGSLLIGGGIMLAATRR